MDQQNSKINREKDESEKEHEKKIKFQIQKLKDKNERKTNHDGFSKDEKIILDNEQPSEETKQIEKRAETRYPSSGDSTGLQTRNRSNRKESMDSDSDEATVKGAITLERTDDGEYTNLHNYSLNTTNCNGSALAQSLCFDNHEKDFTENNLLRKDRCRNLGKKDTNNDLNMNVNERAEEEVLNKCGHTQEQDLNPEFIDIQVRCTTIYFTFERNAMFHRDMEQMNLDSPGQKRSKVDSTNSETFVKDKNGNVIDTAEEKLKHVKNIETRTYMEIDKTINITSSKLSMALYDTHIFPFKHYKNHFTFNPVHSNNDRPLNVHVYAIGFKGGSRLMGVYEDNHSIKSILQTQSLRDIYLRDEHFRLATFSLSLFNHELGEIIRLAGSGFFCDADGGVKCYCCGNTYRGEQLNSHHPDCESHTSDGHVGRSIADHYGESAPATLVPSGQNVQEYRTEAFIDIQIQMRMWTFSYVPVRTQEVFREYALVPEDDINENENELSVREGSMQPRQETEYSANTFSVIEGPRHLRPETLQSFNALSVREIPMPSRQGTLQSSNVLYMRECHMPSRQGTLQSSSGLSMIEGHMPSRQGTLQSSNSLSIREGPMSSRQDTLQSSDELTIRRGSMPARPETLQNSNGLSMRECYMPLRQGTLQNSNGLSMREGPMPLRHGTPHSALEFSVREGPMHSTQETPHDTHIEESVSGSCVNIMGILNGNQRSCVSSHGHEVEGSLGQGSVSVPLNCERRTDQLPLEKTERHMSNTGRRTIKEDVNRESPTKTARLVAENTSMRRRTLCCKCNIRRCNVVFIPCGHLVVCNQCVSSTTDCPNCKKKVYEAHEVGD